MPTAPRQVPHTQAPNNASARACWSAIFATMQGNAVASSARLETTGFAFSAYNASTACAMAFIPDTKETDAGRPQDLLRTNSGLLSSDRLAKNRRRFRTGIGCRNYD